jgi:transglutaminase-like putative cysteine protease
LTQMDNSLYTTRMKTNVARWFDWFSAVVLVAAFGCVAIRLQVTNWTANLEVIGVLVFIACILGLILGASQFGRLASELFAINFTLFFVPWQLGLLVGTQINWDDRLLSVIGRLSYSINEVVNNHPIQDPLLFITAMGILFWVLSFLAGYQLARNGRPWVPLFLLGLALAIIDFYTPFQANRDRYSGVFVFLVLLLVARIYLLRSRREWFEKGMAVDPEIGYDLGRTVAISGLVLVILAWNVPTLIDALTPGTTIQKELAKQWDSVRNRFQNAVAGLQNPVSITSDYYGPELALGTGGTQGDEVVFTILVPGGRPAGVRFYWRARSFDYYDGSQWTTTEENPKTVPADEWPFRYPNLASHTDVILNITPNLTSMRNIYTAGIPLQVNRQAEVLSDTFSDGTTDVVALIANPPLHGGETYQVRSSISNPTILDLKDTTKDYPENIKKLYLQLPDNLSVRVTDLAKQITAGLSNPYDQTEAITDWLRKNIEYQIQIPPVPANMDTLEWFLFDLKQGYCNYYASAEVILLRSLGIPARLAVGYAEGDTESGTNTFTVRRKDSHAWPEVYFADYGWVEFEPTAAQPQRVLPSGEAANSGSSTVPLFTPVPGQGEVPTEDVPSTTGPIPNLNYQNPTRVALTIAIPLLIALSVAIYFWLKRTNRLKFLMIPLPVLVTNNLENRGITPPKWLRDWSNHIRLTPMEKLFTRINWMLILIGRRPQPSHTPAERVNTLVSVAPDVKKTAYTFLTEYQKEEYSNKHGDYIIAKNANRRLWRELAISTLRRLFSGQAS